MKKIITLLFLVCFGFTNAQAFKGKGDGKLDIGAIFQNGGTGIGVTVDFGIGENISYGFGASYVLGVSNGYLYDQNFSDRFDAEVRLNANLGSVFKLDPKMDIYPGLDLSLKNFGAHLGMRYFFTDGFGVFTEAGFPIAKYDSQASGFNNQFNVNVGASFNL
ncbi:DUF6646 family protein [Flavobacterium sp. N3904]|uniref:DUF6646 family protein n=1 Tax=Flavobacterium sp. N3904 TaxID=2986835 RepID=UPI0022250022|nr:DUF6646 family protein [Flavobacterium sp. N3904]